MDDCVPLPRRHLQLGMRLLDKRPLFGAGNLRLRKEEPSARAPFHERPPAPDESADGTDLVATPWAASLSGGNANAPMDPVWHSLDPHVMTTVHNGCDWWGGAVILMAGWYGRLGVRLRASAHAPLRLHELRHTAASLAIEACAHLEADPSTPRSPRRSTCTAIHCRGTRARGYALTSFEPRRRRR
jgi:hypothetical protein